jgi:hypothetical protein
MSRSLKMTSSEMNPEAVLNRKAVVYVRQSTQSQVMINLESQRRQYDLVEVARQRGFADVEIIDDDLGEIHCHRQGRPAIPTTRPMGPAVHRAAPEQPWRRVLPWSASAPTPAVRSARPRLTTHSLGCGRRRPRVTDRHPRLGVRTADNPVTKQKTRLSAL